MSKEKESVSEILGKSLTGVLGMVIVPGLLGALAVMLIFGVVPDAFTRYATGMNLGVAFARAFDQTFAPFITMFSYGIEVEHLVKPGIGFLIAAFFNVLWKGEKA